MDVTEMLELFEKTKDQVEKFFYIPIEFGFVHDPDRLNEELQKKIDLLFREFMINYIPKDKVVILKGSVEERLEQISNYL
jgi:hypothetical protein